MAKKNMHLLQRQNFPSIPGGRGTHRVHFQAFRWAHFTSSFSLPTHNRWESNCEVTGVSLYQELYFCKNKLVPDLIPCPAQNCVSCWHTDQRSYEAPREEVRCDYVTCRCVDCCFFIVPKIAIRITRTLILLSFLHWGGVKRRELLFQIDLTLLIFFHLRTSSPS